MPTLTPLVSAIPIPWNKIIVPNVEINEGAEVFEIRIPLNIPKRTLDRIAIRRAAGILDDSGSKGSQVPLSVKAEKIETVFAILMMDKSIPYLDYQWYNGATPGSYS